VGSLAGDRRQAARAGKAAQPAGGVKVRATSVHVAGVITINPLGRWAKPAKRCGVALSVDRKLFGTRRIPAQQGGGVKAPASPSTPGVVGCKSINCLLGGFRATI
jgi:hypothetical protein